ncbi:MAG: hypothetical protein SFU86_18085 [Pirellulaceae bacterium]|nr:hypothetical protein [Pirellulaceae bacterium]
MNRRWMLVAALLFAALAPFATAEEGWSLPTPFGQPSPPAGSGWKWPKLWPASTPTMPGMGATTSTWQKMRAGTRNIWNKTTDALNPFDDANDAPNLEVTGRNSAFTHAMKASQPQEKSSWWPKLPSPKLPTFGGEKEPETVNSFLARPRPGY